MMTIQRAWWTTVLAIVASSVAFTDACGQMGYGQPMYPAPQAASMYPGALGPGAMAPPAAYQPGWGYAAPANFNYAQQPMMQAAPAYFQEPVASDEAEVTESESLDEYYADGYYPRHGHRAGSVLLGLLGMVAPYSEGGRCEPHWFDLHAEFLYLGLDNGGPFIEFSRDTGGTTRITSNDLEYGDEPGFRVTGTYQTGPGSNLEFTYLGMFDFKEESLATGVDELNSIFTNFLANDPGLQGQEQFDQADSHRISLSNNTDSLELNYRRRWVGPTCLLQGSWLIGVRYTRVKERLRFISHASRDTDADLIDDTGGIGTCIVDATNYMTGPQIGGDLWLCVLPGLNVGLDGKFALLGNNAKQSTRISGVDLADNFIGIVPSEATGNDKVTFLGEASLNVNYRVNHRLTIRAGYELILLEGVALALENFNPEVPLFGFTRTPSFSDGGALFYDGFTFGAELMW